MRASAVVVRPSGLRPHLAHSRSASFFNSSTSPVLPSRFSLRFSGRAKDIRYIRKQSQGVFLGRHLLRFIRKRDSGSACSLAYLFRNRVGDGNERPPIIPVAVAKLFGKRRIGIAQRVNVVGYPPSGLPPELLQFPSVARQTLSRLARQFPPQMDGDAAALDCCRNFADAREHDRPPYEELPDLVIVPDVRE